jgi:hypothetical protein
LPRGEFEALAMGDPDAAAIHAIAVAAEASDTLHDNLLVDVAHRSLPAAVDVLWEVATTVTDASRSDDLAALAAQAIAYAEAHPRPAWVDAVNDTDEFVARLETEVTQWTSDAASGGDPSWQADDNDFEDLGFGDMWDWVREAGSRVKGAIGHNVSKVPVNLWRESLQSHVTAFLGDILVYQTRRGTASQPGAVDGRVLSAIRDAEVERSVDDPLLLIGHSMGGNVLYDVLTTQASEVDVDAFVTVGSQVAWFEELKQFRSSDVAIRGSRKVARPVKVAHWLNVFDPLDILSFSTRQVFDGTHDLEYSSGTSLVAAHMSYFRRPSFHRRLGTRLANLLKAGDG